MKEKPIIFSSAMVRVIPEAFINMIERWNNAKR
jgi:hypothetical protein